jgi:iron complex outermembrane receptor protein
VEFIKGPGSALYGTGALIGVVNIITKKGEDVNGAEVRVKAGSFNKEAYATYGKKINDKTDLFFNASVNDAKGDEIDQPANLDVVPPGQTKAAGKVYWNKYPTNFSFMTSFRSEYLTIHLRDEHYVRATPRGVNGSYYVWDEEQWKPEYDEDQYYIDATGTIPLPFISENSKLIVEPSVHFYHLDEQTWVSFGANTMPPLGSRSGQITDELHEEFKAYFQGNIIEPLNLTLGYDGIYSKFLQSLGVSLTDGRNISLAPEYINPGKLFLNGAFAQGIWTYNKYLLVNAGLRFDAFDGQANPALTPRCGVIYHPVEDASLKILYGRSFLAPQWAHQHTATSATQAFQSNPDLKPERLDAGDFIIDYTFYKTLNIDLDGFCNGVSDIISAQTVGGIQRYVNMGKAQFAGGEAEAKIAVLKSLKLDASVSYVRNIGADSVYKATNMMNGQLRSVSPYILRYGVEYGPLKNLIFSAWGRSYAGQEAFNPANYNKVDGWTAIDATANYSFMNFDLQLQVLNVANQYYEIGDNAATRLPLPRYERGYHVSLAYKF